MIPKNSLLLALTLKILIMFVLADVSYSDRNKQCHQGVTPLKLYSRATEEYIYVSGNPNKRGDRKWVLKTGECNETTAECTLYSIAMGTKFILYYPLTESYICITKREKFIANPATRMPRDQSRCLFEDISRPGTPYLEIVLSSNKTSALGVAKKRHVVRRMPPCQLQSTEPFHEQFRHNKNNCYATDLLKQAEILDDNTCENTKEKYCRKIRELAAKNRYIKIIYESIRCDVEVKLI